MKRIIALSILLTLLATTAILASDDEQTKNSSQPLKPVFGEGFSLYGRLQTQGYLQALRDDFGDNNRVYLFMKQARLGLAGTYEDIRINFQLAFGGEEEIKAPSPGISLSLLDLSADIPLTEAVHVKVGQFKVPYGREGLTNTGSMQFSERSVQYLGFKMGRDVGIAIVGSSGDFVATAGVFTGGGRNVPIRMIPQELGLPLVAVRAGINKGYDNDLYDLKQTNGSHESGYAIFANAFYTKDSKIGHSTALNVKTADKSLLLNSNWNPFIGKRPFDKGIFWQAGADAAFRSATENSSISGEVELNYGSYKNDFGSIELFAGRTQLAYSSNPFEVALRYSFLQPDDKFAFVSQGKSYPLLDNSLIQEATLGLSYFIKNGRVKVTADLPVMFGAPVIIEPNIGAYVLTEQPDQAAYIAAPTNGKIERQTVVSPRLQLQVIF
ncbi:MAG TPA: porin [Bacteroidota bacterium]|nr:porin [Bacteroidota bacterium]